MMAVDVDTDNGISIGGARVVFEGNYALDPLAVGIPNYDVSADGERFLMVGDAAGRDATAPLDVVLVENWHQELLERVPVP